VETEEFVLILLPWRECKTRIFANAPFHRKRCPTIVTLYTSDRLLGYSWKTVFLTSHGPPIVASPLGAAYGTEGQRYHVRRHST
jgi:hypothetical protein